MYRIDIKLHQLPITASIHNPAETTRNVFKSLPDATSCRKSKNLLISALRAMADFTNKSSGKATLGICGGDLFMKAAALVQRNKIDIERTRKRQIRVNK
eukprot:Gb_22654 [translate_table: standard]